MDGQLEQVQGVLTEFSRVEAGLAALRERHGNTVYEVTTTAGMDAAKAARAEIREPRFAVEKVRKAAKAPLLELGRRIDAEAIRITEAILAIEERVASGDFSPGNRDELVALAEGKAELIEGPKGDAYEDPAPAAKG